MDEKAGDATVRSAVDDALELATALNTGALAPALAGAWAALESLLTERRDPDERGNVVAATRAAALVACSWPRAELTALSHQVRMVAGDSVYASLAECETGRQRAHVVADHLRRVGRLPLRRSWRTRNDACAITRMRALLNDPREVLGRVQFHVEVSLRRLYRSRNIVLHGGSTGGVALPAALRVTAPLVGAALDRVTHAYLVGGTSPLALAARADVALKLVGDDLGPHVCDLLE